MKKNLVEKKKEIGLFQTKDIINILNSPLDKHYKELQIQPLDIAKANFTPDEYKGYLKITAHKYLMRHPHKGKPIEDLEKCKFFIDKLIDYYTNVDPPF